MNKPNLIYVFADQWRRGAMGCANQDPVLTPRMDAFAEQGVRCTACTSTFPLCSPHRASLLTGKYPFSTGFFTNCKPGIPLRLQDEEYGMGDILKDNGYQTAYIGKYHLDEPEVNHEEAPKSGARDWDAFTPKGVRRHGFDFWYSYGTYDVHLHPHYWKDSPEMIQVDKWSVEHETDIAIDWLQQVDHSQPFAAVISWNPPHSPYDQVPQRYLDLYPETLPKRKNVKTEHICHHTSEPYTGDLDLDTRRYYAAVSGLDDQFGRLLDALEEMGLAENTIVVLSADHGDMMGSHGLMAKHVWYEESIGIPFLVRGPKIPQGLCGSVFGSQDQLPTVLGLLGVDVPQTIEGVDCSNDIFTASTDSEKFTFLCAAPGSTPVLKLFADAGKDPHAFGWRGVRTAKYTYVVEVGYRPEAKMQRLLYDLEQDPLQMNPIQISNPNENQVASCLEQRLSQWLRQQKDPFYTQLCSNNTK